MRAFVLFLIVWIFNGSQAADHVIYERCMRGKFHKTIPGPEENLQTCSHFSDKACCTNDTAASLRDDDALYGFNYSHCAPMSKECQNFFLQNNCFYECSPNVWPWLSAVDSSYRKERYHNVPLCAGNCNAWWDACRLQQTCVTTWSTGFTWKNKVNECPEGSKCRSFEQVYKNATFFCENVWGPNDYKVVDNGDANKPCIEFIFHQSNPNKKTADFYAKQSGLICDQEEKQARDEEIKSLKTKVAVLAIFFAIIVFVIFVACIAYFRLRPAATNGDHSALPQHSAPPSQVIHLHNHHQRTSESLAATDTDSKVSFVNDIFNDSDRQPLHLNAA